MAAKVGKQFDQNGPNFSNIRIEFQSKQPDKFAVSEWFDQ